MDAILPTTLPTTSTTLPLISAPSTKISAPSPAIGANGVSPSPVIGANGVSPYYELSIYVSDPALKQKYLASAAKQNALFHDATIDESDKYYDAGFDLFVPTEQVVEPGTTVCVNHAITCAMLLYDPRTYTYTNTSYYLYVRSSTATKTPLRLANAVGIIDAGYRGQIIAAFDHNCLGKGTWQKKPFIIGLPQPFIIEQYQRLVQLCPPNLSLPFCVRVVDSLKDLGGFSDSKNGRGTGGFGSTGY